MKKFIVMADFTKGMIDSVKPDVNFESGMQSPSIQWLENLNPNVLLSGLVHREGFTYAALSNSTEVEKDTDGNYYGCNEFVDLVKKEYVNSTDNPDDYLLFSVPVKIVNPKDSRAWFICLKAKEDVAGTAIFTTRVVGYYCILEYGVNNQVTGESWSWIEPFVDHLKNPGDKIYTVASDYSIRGQNILMVGVPDPGTYDALKEYISPIYVWGYENMRKSKSLFAPDTDQWTEHDKQKWKIVSSGKLRKDMVDIVRILPPLTVETNYIDAEGWKDGELDVRQDIKDSVIKTTEDHIFNPLRKKLDLVIWQSRCLPKYIDQAVDRKVLNLAFDKLDLAYDYTEMFADLSEGPHRAGTLPFTANDKILVQFEDIETDSQIISNECYYYPQGGGIALYRGIKVRTTFNLDAKKLPEYIRVGAYGTGHLHTTQETNLPIESVLNNVDLYDMMKYEFDNFADTYPGVAGPSPNRQKRVLLCVNYLFDYGHYKIPRMWCYGEKIPWVITIVINGVETILKEGSFNVFGGAMYGSQSNTNIYYPEISWYSGSYTFGESDFLGNTPARNRYDCPFYCYRPVYDSVTEDVWFAEKIGITSYRGSWVQGWYLQCAAARLPFIYFTLRFDNDDVGSFYNMLPEGATELKLYFSLPDNGHPIIKDRFGVEGLYGSALAKKKTGNTEYALAKVFPLVKYVEEVVKTTRKDFKSFTKSSQGDLAVSDGKWVYLGMQNNIEYDPSLHLDAQYAQSGGRGWYFVPDSYSDTVFAHSDTGTLPTGKSDCVDTRWTPDFCLWDFPEGQLLADNIGNAFKMWEGRGAKLVEVVKGQPFIAGCINSEGMEEVGRIRYTVKQKTNISNDRFAENDFLTLGKFPHTALASFREQLWAFSRYQVHRVQFHDIYDSFKYEVLEAMEGQGTFNIKTVCTGQEGVYWCNEHGIWFSDGRTPQTISDGITSTYSILSTRRQFEFTRDYISIDPNDIVDGINTTLELNYDTLHNEVVLSSKVIVPESVKQRFKLSSDKHEFRMVYNVKNRNWRIESMFLIPGIHTISLVNKLKTPLDQLYDTRLLVDGNKHILSFGMKNENTINDVFIRSKNDTSTETTKVSCDYLIDFGEIGNGLDDYLFGSAKVEIEPYRFNKYTTTVPADPQYDCTQDGANDYCDPAMFLDNASGVADVNHTSITLIDLVERNFKNKQDQCIYIGAGSTPTTNNKEVTSLNLQSPIVKYRHLRVWLKGKNAKVIRSIVLFYNDIKRKFFT